MRDLPSSITARAFSSGGEYAFRRRDVREAIDAIVRSGQAIVHWEVWMLVGERGVTHFLPPASPGQPVGVCAAWSPDQNEGEPWADYCARCGKFTVEDIERVGVENSLPAEMVDRIRYNFFYVAEGEG